MSAALPLRILIVDDEQPARARLRELLSDCRAEVPHQVVGEVSNGFEALDAIAAAGVATPESVPTLVLADMHMPGMNGIELARHLGSLSRSDGTVGGIDPPAVIFVTAHDQYAVAAFETNAVDYLLKPVRAARLAAALKKAGAGARTTAEVLSRLDPQPRRHFSVAERGRVVLVPVNDVLFLKAGQKYVALVTREREFLVEDSLTSLEEEFASLFVRIHRSTLVARRYLRGVERMKVDRAERPESADRVEEGEVGVDAWGVVLEGWPEPLPVSRRQWPQIKVLVKGG